jgi:hypothetical protein
MLISSHRAGVLGTLVASLVVTTTIGCGKQSTEVPVHPARGTVLYGNKPIAGAIVSLHAKQPASELVPAPTATVQPDGSFRLTTYQSGDGAPEGEYVATLHWFRPVDKQGELQPGPNVLPKKYAKPESSDIVVRIAAGANELPPIKLR